MKSRPNILFIHTDQLRHDFLSLNGASFIDTPNIEEISSDSVNYTHAYCASPLCVPTRNEWLTGMTSVANGVMDNKHFHNPVVKTVPQMFYESGYFTAAIGKMHNYPWDLQTGYRLRIVADDKRHHYLKDDYQDYLLKHGYTRKHAEHTEGYTENLGAVCSELPPELQIDVFIGNEAVDFIKKNDREPFYLSVGFAGPHCPYDPSVNLVNKYSPDDMPDPIPDNHLITKAKDIILDSCLMDWCKLDFRKLTNEKAKKIRAHYSALVDQIDSQIGRIINTLKEKDLYDETLIIITSDHADMLGDYGMPYKHLFFETSIHVPLIIHYPGQSNQVRCDDLVQNGDLVPTCMYKAGLDIPDYFDLQCLPEIPGNDDIRKRDYIWGATDLGMMIRTRDHKLSMYETGEVQLVDLKKDPMEQHDFSCDRGYHDIFRNLSSTLISEVSKALKKRNRELLIRPKDKSEFGKRGWERPFPYI